MRRTRAVTLAVACLLALAASTAAALALAGPTTATPGTTTIGTPRTIGINIGTRLTVATGTLGIIAGTITTECNASLWKEFVFGLTTVNDRGLTRIGRAIAGRLWACTATLLNIADNAGETPPGPTATSYDLAFKSSDPGTGAITYAILDFQVEVTVGPVRCLYRGAVDVRTSGLNLEVQPTTVLPLAAGDITRCPGVAGVFGGLTNNPSILYALLVV